MVTVPAASIIASIVNIALPRNRESLITEWPGGNGRNAIMVARADLIVARPRATS